MHTLLPSIFAISGLLTASTIISAADTTRPNIVYILADDLGYGDVHCLGGERSKIATPNIDRLAGQGMIFTESHSSAAVCTPSRYGILTGRYNWRSRAQSSVLGQYAEPLIDKDRLTVPEMLKQHGYQTACIGKWHLGMHWTKRDNEVDFTRPISEGPTARGFDYYFGLDIPNHEPYCFIENDHTVGIPSVQLPMERGSRHCSPGLAMPDWNVEAILPTITAKACDYIQHQAKIRQPFFLYFPLNSPHTPIAPTKEWQGKSGLGDYADFVMETDWAVGQILTALDQSGSAGNTLVIFTSDNGSPANLEGKGHFVSELRRGHKSDIWDGGHRIPFITRWPGKIKPGTHSSQLICLNDLMATSADILGAKLPDTAGEDSVSILPALLGADKAPLHEALVHHSGKGYFAIRQGRWKLELCWDSGGFQSSKEREAGQKELPDIQLYDISTDIAETKNLQAEQKGVVNRLTTLLEKYVADGRSTPGIPQKKRCQD